MKKMMIILGACITSLMIISTVTALPQTNSTPIMNTLTDIEEQKTKLNNIDIEPGGIIDLIKQLVLLIIQFVLSLIQIIRDLIGLVSLIEYLINLINVLITAIFDLIETILNLFNPSLTT